MSSDSSLLSCFTIGHSNHRVPRFLELLDIHSIEYVVDVRSIPYSRHNHQYNRESIKSDLEKNKIHYIFMGDALGARRDAPELFFADERIVDYSKVRKLESFAQSISGLLNYLKQGRKVVLMCAEKDPFNCHRFVLISYALAKKGVIVKHILDNGKIVLNGALEDKLILKYKLDCRQQTLFKAGRTRNDIIEEGYIMRNKEIALVKKSNV